MRAICYVLLCLSGIAMGTSRAPSIATEPIVEVVIRNVGHGFSKLDRIFKEPQRWQNDPTEAINEALQATDMIAMDLQTGSYDIVKGPPIALAESMKLADWLSALTKFYESTMLGYVEQKAKMQAAGKGEAVCIILKRLAAGCFSFNNAIQEKTVNTAKGSSDRTTKREQAGHVETAMRMYNCPVPGKGS